MLLLDYQLLLHIPHNILLLEIQQQRKDVAKLVVIAYKMIFSIKERLFISQTLSEVPKIVSNTSLLGNLSNNS